MTWASFCLLEPARFPFPKGLDLKEAHWTHVEIELSVPRQEGQVRFMANLWRNPDLGLGTEKCEDKLVMSAWVRADREEC